MIISDDAGTAALNRRDLDAAGDVARKGVAVEDRGVHALCDWVVTAGLTQTGRSITGEVGK